MSANKSRGGWRSESLVAELMGSCPFENKDKLRFDATEYLSNDGMQTAIFGPIFWTAIHIVSFNYPVKPTTKDARRYERWMRSIGDVLPCKYCRDNFSENYRDAKNGEDVYRDRESFSRFCHRLHSRVNSMLKKKGDEPSYEELRDVYEGFRSRCLTSKEEEKMTEHVGELGCVTEKHAGTKGKCVVNIVPRNYCPESLLVSNQCRRRS